MRKFVSFVVLLWASQVIGQVALQPNSPTYNWQVLAGSVRQISTNITVGGSQCASPANLCTINWSIASTTGGASATFTDPTHTAVSSISGALPSIQVNIGSTAGNCSITPASGSSGPYTISSTATVTVQAQSTDNTSITTTFLFDVCANSTPILANGTTSVYVAPAYQQVYQGQTATIQSWVTGCVDETGTWSVVSQPAGASITLPDTTYRDAVFPGSTVTGRYVLKYTANCNSGTGTAIIYVSPNASPSYVVTPNGTRPHECYPDPALTGADYEIGAGKAYSTIRSTPLYTTITAGTIYRLWNTDTTGSNPSTYPEYFQISINGTPTQPIIFCGVPDSYGNLPIMSGSGATGPSAMSPSNGTVGYGLLSLWTGPSHYGYWQSGVDPPSYVSVTGISFQNVNPNNTYTQPGGVSGPCISGVPSGNQTVCNWYAFSAGVQARSGSYIDFSGIESNNTTLGVFTDDNSNNAWATMTQAVTLTGSNLHNCGWSNIGSHCAYIQSLYTLVEGNALGPGADSYYTSGDGPSGLKFRGIELIARYNNVGVALSRSFDLTDEQDGYPYVDLTYYTSLWGDGDEAGANVIAGYQESLQKDILYGNIAVPSDGGQIHYGGDELGGLESRQGVVYVYNNTFIVIDPILDNIVPGNYMAPHFDIRNNIFWSTTPSNFEFTRFQDSFVNATTNLFATGSVDITPPLIGGDGGSGSQGWGAGYTGVCSDQSTCLWPLTNPVSTHLYGLTSANYLFTSTQPFNSTTYVPPTGSAAISAGTVLTGIPAQNPVRYQWTVAAGGGLTARQNVLTIGAVDSGPAPTLTSITIAPSSAMVVVTGTQQFAATCHYSDGSSDLCTTSVSWASSNSAAVTINSVGLAAAVSVGSSTITATLSPAIPGTATMSVYTVPGSQWWGLSINGYSGIR